MTVAEIIKRLESLANAGNVAGMARFGIRPREAFGVPAPEIKKLARAIGKNHGLALELWQTGYHEARLLAGLVDEPHRVAPEQMDAWAKDFDNWAVCDSICGTLFSRTPHAYEKAFRWATGSEEEFVKRAGIVLMAWLAVHDKKAADGKIARFLPVLETLSGDGRNFIKKAVNWALRQIGKRSLFLNRLAVEAAERIRAQDTRPARWIAAGALRELRSPAVQERLAKKAGAPFASGSAADNAGGHA